MGRSRAAAQRRGLSGPLAIGAGLCAGLVLSFSGAWVWGQVVGEAAETPAVEVVDEVVGETESRRSAVSRPKFCLAPAAARQDATAARYFQRRSTEAFVDPDRVSDLEAKYHYVLEDQDRAPAGAAVAPVAALMAAAGADLGALAPWLPLDMANPPSGCEWAWLDYAVREPKTLVLLLPAAENEPAHLVVCRVARGAGQAGGAARTVDRLTAQRALADELAPAMVAGRRLAVWDRPAAWGPKGMLLGRVVALLVQPTERFAVNLFSERLHPDSDCRLWLTHGDDPWGTPAGLRLATIPLRRPSGQLTPVDVLEVDYPGAESLRRVGLEFPLAITPALDQMRQAANQAARSGRGNSAADAAKLLGDELVEEIECRLVNAKYR